MASARLNDRELLNPVRLAPRVKGALFAIIKLAGFCFVA
jgi:hypothetical protein